jgi:hypothetical protein
MNKDLQAVMKWTPLYFYQGGKAAQGLNASWLSVLLGATLLRTAIAWVLFQRRDIRVSGERSLTRPVWGSLRRGR